MDPAITGGLIQGGSQLAGGLLGGQMSRGAQRRQRKFTREVMQNQMQWKAEDLRKAGLNPILAVSQGGSPTAPGTSATAPNVDLDVDYSKHAHSARQRALLKEQENQVKLDNEIRTATAQEAKARAQQAEAEAQFRTRQLYNIGSDEKLMNAHTLRNEMGVPGWAVGLGLTGDDIKDQIGTTAKKVWNYSPNWWDRIWTKEFWYDEKKAKENARKRAERRK